MPIRPELRKFYGREWREVTRPRILKRAKDLCEECRKPNGTLVETFTDRTVMGLPVMFWRVAGSQWHDWTGIACPNLLSPCHDPRFIYSVLTIAHLNHTPGDDRDENLKALCQWCHLNYDKLHHHETRAARKDAARPLLGYVASVH